jgi:hypothetical protein
MNISNPIAATTEISSNFGIVIGMIIAACIFIFIVWLLMQLRSL